jgi:hypothetical protein
MMPCHPMAGERDVHWRKNRRLVRRGFKDLEYLPPSRARWNATLAAYAYSARRRTAHTVDLNQWAVMQGCPASSRYSELGEDALVLWHGTSAARAEKIATFGLFHKRGLWTTLEPRIAHGYSRSRAHQHQTGSATVLLLLDSREMRPGEDYDHESPEVFRFHSGLPPESVEYILWDDRIEFLGSQQARRPRPWGIARFKRREGQWVPRSQPPVRFDDQHRYHGIEAWLDLSVRRILSTLGSAASIEVFSSLYATLDPWEALTHEDIFRAMERQCDAPRHRRGIKLFSLAIATQAD